MFCVCVYVLSQYALDCHNDLQILGDFLHGIKDAKCFTVCEMVLHSQECPHSEASYCPAGLPWPLLKAPQKPPLQLSQDGQPPEFARVQRGGQRALLASEAWTAPGLSFDFGVTLGESPTLPTSWHLSTGTPISSQNTQGSKTFNASYGTQTLHLFLTLYYGNP